MTMQAPIYVRTSRVPAVFGIGKNKLYEMEKAGEITIYRHSGTAVVRVTEMMAALEGKPEADVMAEIMVAGRAKA